MAATEQDLQALIQKYYLGDTSLEEERQLLEIFQDPAYAHDELRIQFLYFQEKRDQSPPASLLPRLEERLAGLPVSTRRAVHYRITWRIAAMMVVTIGIGWMLAYRYLYGTITLEGTAQHTPYQLPDGTTAWLDEGAVLEYDRDFQEDRRVVSLEGEGYFEVTKDASRPFVIRTQTTTTQVLGTAFNLRARPDESTVELSVTEGKVIFGADEKIEVRAGESATFDEPSRRVATAKVNVNATSWKTRELNFKNARLRTVFRDLGRYYHIKIKAENPALLNCRLTAYFKGASLEHVLKVVIQSTDLTYTVEGDTYWVRGKTNCEE